MKVVWTIPPEGALAERAPPRRERPGAVSGRAVGRPLPAAVDELALVRQGESEITLQTNGTVV
jgi:hypothetical protein